MLLASGMSITNQALDTQNKSDLSNNNWALIATIATVFGIIIANISQLVIAHNIKEWRGKLEFSIDQLKIRQCDDLQAQLESTSAEYQRIKQQFADKFSQLMILLQGRVSVDHNFAMDLSRHPNLIESPEFQALGERINIAKQNFKMN